MRPHNNPYKSITNIFSPYINSLAVNAAFPHLYRHFLIWVPATISALVSK
jgi:hypothetical protein